MNKPLRVVINAQVQVGRGGGVEQFVIGLVASLGRLTDGPEEYIVAVPPDHPDWLQPYLGANQRVAIPPVATSRFGPLKRVLGPLGRPTAAIWHNVEAGFARRFREPPEPEPNPGSFLESLRGDMVHFPHQGFVPVRLPTVFNPHDLQHRHLPQFFSSAQIAARDDVFRAGCGHATAVVAESQWTKRDIVNQLGTNPSKVFVIALASPTEFIGQADSASASLRRKFDLPEMFALYPAQTWRHKNHLGLLRAVRLLQETHGLTLHVVCTGRQNEFWPEIKRTLRRAHLGDQVHFLGFIAPDELRTLYRLARFLIYPSLFEGGGIPVVEAFSEGLPVACSAVTAIPEYAGDAALLFDPSSPASMADAMWRLATDDALHEALRRKGLDRARQFRWKDAAKIYRALYRSVTGRTLSEEDTLRLASALESGARVPSGPASA